MELTVKNQASGHSTETQLMQYDPDLRLWKTYSLFGAVDCKDAVQGGDVYQISADIFKELGEQEMLALVLQNISTLQLRTGKQLQAVATMSSALEHKPKLSFREKIIQKLLHNTTKKLNG